MSVRASLIVMISLFCVFTSYAQQDTLLYERAPIEIITKHEGNSVFLRWAYITPDEWLEYRNVRFDLFRRSISGNEDFTQIASDIGVADQAILENRFSENEDASIAAVYNAYYGDWDTMSEDYGVFDKKDELESKFLMLNYAIDINFEAAQLAGLGYEDDQVNADEDYMYRLVPRDEILSPRHKSAIVREETIPLNIDITSEEEGYISFGWIRALYETKYTGYYIEKSSDNRTFTRLNKLPYIHVETDRVGELSHILWSENVENYNPAYYRVIGIDAFGQLSEPSESVQLMGRDKTPPTPPMIRRSKLNDSQTHVDIEWEHNQDLDNDLDKLVLQKAIDINGPYFDVEELDKKSTSYQDQETSIIQAVYYRVCAVDTAQNSSCTRPSYTIIDDKIPPVAPVQVTGNIDTSGVVTLTWEPNMERDLLGYYIHMANGENRVFVNLSDEPYRKHTWHDTIRLDVLTEEIYYRVVAVDLRYNYSPYSETVTLHKPDIVPPFPSIFDGYKVLDDSIRLDLALSQSKDVERILLIRETAGNKTEIDLNLDTRVYFDQEIEPNKDYTYSLLTIDDAGNATPSPASLKLRSKLAKIDDELRLKYDINGDEVQVSWELDANNYDHIKLYKGSSEDQVISYKSFKKEEAVSFPLSLVKDQYLQARIVYADGRKSRMSNAIHVSID